VGQVEKGSDAVVDRLLIDLDAAGRASVSTWLEGELPGAVGEPVGLAWPLGASELEDLRWYLEDYLQAPFGVYEERGSQVSGRLPVWGQAMFSSLFGSGPARDAYVKVRTRVTRSGAAEIVLRSGVPAWLGLPWELLCDPSLAAPLALDGMGLSRSLPTKHLGESFEVGGQRLRVLMVISRPGGPRDVGYRVIVRPLLHRLAAVRGQVEVEVLRPPTLEALAERLRAAREARTPFQIVHFDGHGLLSGDRSGPPLAFGGQQGEGALVFERHGGGVDHVPARRFVEVLAEAGVPVVVLNACRSGAVGKQLEAAVATRLLTAGAEAVVAMAYNVYTVAAAEFMTAFYARLFAGETVGEAVRAGRARMARRPERPSPKGALPLADWAVPVYYRRREVCFPHLRLEPRKRADLSLDEELDRLREPSTGGRSDPLDPEEEFVGRDGLFHTLEAVARTGHVVLLHGPAGTGKTELAKAFGRWWRDTGGVDRPEWVLWHSFQPGVASFDLDGVISTIGLSVFGPDFALKDRDSRRERLHDLLCENRLLLVWDNFESIVSMPDPTGATSPLADTGCGKLKDFLRRVATDSRSVILITSRTPENWLGSLQRLAVGGLAHDEAVEYANHLLEPLPSAAPRRAARAFGELLEWLDGHPLSMRLILPHLEDIDAAHLLAGLRGTSPLPGDIGDGRTDRLPASITYSIAHLDPADRRLLTAVCLFHGVVVAGMLGMFSSVEQAPQRFRGIDPERWVTLLDRAAHVGLLTALGEGVYGIHPALPAHLASQWRAEEPDAYSSQRAAAEQALLHAHTALGVKLFEMIRTGDAPRAYRAIGVHGRTMGHLLGYALDHRLWLRALAIAQPLDDYWDRCGRDADARSWVDRALLALEASDGVPPPLDEPAGELWLFLVDTQTKRLIRAGDLDAAESACSEARDMLLAQPGDARQRGRFTGVYHRLGDLAQARGRWDDAEKWYRASLAIEDELGDRNGMAWSYRDLGGVARARARWDEAKKWYSESLTIKKEQGDRRGMALAFDGLGNLKENQRRWDEAKECYRQSLVISQDLGDQDGVARSFHHLGMVAERLGQFDEAKEWYRQSLSIAEKQRDQPARAASYYQLGRLALRLGQLDEAEQWCHQSLVIAEKLNDPFRMAGPYQLLSAVALLRKQLDEAERWVRRALSTFEDLSDQLNMAGSYHLLGQIMQDRGQWNEAEQCYRKSLTIEKGLDDHTGMAVSYGQLGRLAGDRGNVDDALNWTIQSVAIFDQLSHSTTSVAHHQLAHLARRLGIYAVEQRWARVIGATLSKRIRKFLEAYEYGTESQEDG